MFGSENRYLSNVQQKLQAPFLLLLYQGLAKQATAIYGAVVLLETCASSSGDDKILVFLRTRRGDTLWAGKCLLTFQKIVLPLSSG
jgi:hypothetical protein